MNTQPGIQLKRRQFAPGRKRLKVLGSIIILAALTLFMRGLLHTNALQWIDSRLSALSENENLIDTALNMEWSAMPSEHEPVLLKLLSAQSAPLAALADGFGAAPVNIIPTLQPPDAPTPGNVSAAATFRPGPLDSQPPSEPSPAGTTPPFTPDPRASMLREGTFVPSSSKGYDAFGSVFINNDSGITVDVEKLLSQKVKLNFQAGKPQILIVHTHASESYFPDEENWYVPTDVERTEDTSLNVVRIGDELEKIFTGKGLNVLHDRNIYDYPVYSGSYTRTLESITKYINDNPSIVMVIDIHRDSIATDDGYIYKAVTDIEGEKVAQMMLVMGTDAGGLPHPQWRENLAFAANLQKTVTGKYPNLMRPINLRRDRFNMHATTGSILLEVGTAGNSLTEALRAINIFGELAGDYLAGMAE